MNKINKKEEIERGADRVLTAELALKQKVEQTPENESPVDTAIRRSRSKEFKKYLEGK